jgi:hypothetical protein
VGYEDKDCNPTNGGVSDAQGGILLNGELVGGGTPTSGGLEYICGYRWARSSNPFSYFEQ